MVRSWHGRGIANVNQTRPHCVNQMGKTHSKTLAVRHGRGTAWARHAMCESAFTVSFSSIIIFKHRIFLVTVFVARLFRNSAIRLEKKGIYHFLIDEVLYVFLL
jgi:hypothetical protein